MCFCSLHWNCVIVYFQHVLKRFLMHFIVTLLRVNSTYKTVRLVPRPWRNPEGTINHAVFKTILKGILSHLMETPGVTSSALRVKYAAVLEPVSLSELLEVSTISAAFPGWALRVSCELHLARYLSSRRRAVPNYRRETTEHCSLMIHDWRGL